MDKLNVMVLLYDYGEKINEGKYLNGKMHFYSIFSCLGKKYLFS